MAGRASLAGPSVSACTYTLSVHWYVYTQLYVLGLCVLYTYIMNIMYVCVYVLSVFICMEYSSHNSFQRITV